MYFVHSEFSAGNTSLNIPNNISLIDVTINCSNYSSGEVKISGMKLAKSIPFIVLASKVFLQGPFIPASDPPAMTTALNSGGFIQTSQPYSASPWNYAGTEEVSPSFFTNNPSIADWILVELRTSIAPSPSDPRRAAFLKSDGNMVGLDGESKRVTLSCFVFPDATYSQFKDALETFVNYAEAWKLETKAFA